MTDTTQSKRTGLIGLFLALLVGAGAGTGGTLLLNQGELAHAYVCTATGDVGIFNGGISGTALTGYPYAENRTGSIQCKNPAGTAGKWLPCATYAAAHNATCSEIVQQKANADGRVVLRQELVNYDGTHTFLKCVAEE